MNSAGSWEGEAQGSAVHGTWGAIKRHRNAGETLCAPCRELHRAYYRDYERTRRLSAVERDRRAVAQKQWRERNRAAIRDYSRRYYRRQLEEARRAVDPIAVERFVTGDDVPLNRAEKACAYKEMLRHGLSRNQVVARLRISWTTARIFDEREAS